MFTTFINDCRDDNARGRQESRIGSLLDTSISFVGVESDLEAGVQLIDILDATEGRPGLILVNVAPRGGHTVKWENGTPFGYCMYKDTLIIASVDGYVLSAIKQFGLATEFNLLDTHTASSAMLEAGFIDKDAALHIPLTQFRSFDFTPRVGAFMCLGNTVPSTPYSLETVPELPPAVWHIDNFGNCKTTLTKDQINSTGTTETRYGALSYFEQLRHLPDNATGLVEGSSGLGTTRFIEIMTQRTNFATHNGVKIGDDIFTDKNYFKKATQ